MGIDHPTWQQLAQDWFDRQLTKIRLTNAAQRLWRYLLQQACIRQFYEIRSADLAAALQICGKTLERARAALQAAGLLHYEVRGKQVYYRLVLPAALWQQDLLVGDADVIHTSAIDASVCAMHPQIELQSQALGAAGGAVLALLAQLAEQVQAQAAMLAQLQAQLAAQTAASATACQTSAAEEQTDQTPAAEQASSQTRQSLLRSEEKTPINAPQTAPQPVYWNRAAYCTYQKAETSRSPDILFNDRYEIFLQDYLDQYGDNRLAEACFNHFAMVKEVYRSRGKKRLTEQGFYRILQELEQLTGTDVEQKLAIMERSLRNNWVGFFPLPENTPEYQQAARKKQGRKRASYRNSYASPHGVYQNFKSKPRDLSGLER